LLLSFAAERTFQQIASLADACHGAPNMRGSRSIVDLMAEKCGRI